jgi:hypothetical protein
MDPRFTTYARDVLIGLLDTEPPAAHEVRPGRAPHVRFTLHFPTDDAPHQNAGTFADLVSDRITPREMWPTDELLAMGEDIQKALLHAVGCTGEKLSVSYALGSARTMPGRNLTFTIHSASHETPKALHTFLNEKRLLLLTEMGAACGKSGRSPYNQ